MSETSRTINFERKSINHVYGGRFKSTLIENPLHYAVTYKYVLQNPLRSKLTTNLVNYDYTSLSISLGQKKGIIPISPHLDGLDHLTPKEDDDNFIEWIHDCLEVYDTQIIKQALSKRVFKMPKERASGKEKVIQI